MNIMSLRGFWLKTISYDDSPRVVVTWEIQMAADGSNFMSVDQLMYLLSSPFIIHRRHSGNETNCPWGMRCSRFMFL